MSQFTAEMKAQLMKVTGITDVEEFDQIVKQHAPHIENFNATFEKHSPFDIRMVMFKEQVESRGMKEYKNLPDVEEKLNYVYSILLKDPDFKDVQNLCPHTKGEKDADKSKRSRDLGNKNFQKKVYEEAIRYYSESILLGPIHQGKGREAALGLGNRSVVLFALNDFDACLDDIAGALELGYPEEMHYKVFERRGRCLQALGKITEAKASFEAALEALSKANIAEEKKPPIMSDLKTALEMVEKETETAPVALLTDRHKFRVWNPHKQFPCMSDSVEVKYNPDVGRHGVATHTINPGEVILIEEPLSWTVNVKNFSTVCQYCVKQVGRTPFPSPTHPTAVYCSYSCLVKYRDTLGCLDSLPMMEMFSCEATQAANSVILAFRAIVQQPAEFFIKNKDKLFSRHDPEYGTKEQDNWKLAGPENIYKGMYNLVNHIDKLSEQRELEAIIKSAFLLRYLICGGYFPSSSPESPTLTDDEMFLGGLLFLFQCGTNYNQHGIYRAESVIEAGKKLPLEDVGAAFYPTMVLLNHSCCPNTLRINHGRVTYIVAKHLIKAGEEVSDCYGMHHLGTGIEERKQTIERGFLFNCKCQACVDNWPLLHELEMRLTPAEMGKLGNLLSKYQTNFREHKLRDAMECCVEYLRKMAEMGVRAPHRNYEIASMALSSCYWAELQ